jgi:Leucine-rich repeat (LRR) protein
LVEYVSLSSNELNGILRPELGSAKSLKELRLAGNPLQGTIPDSYANLINLNILHLGDSRFDEAFIPDFIYDLTNLIELQLDNCSLIGGIDFGIGNLEKLNILRLDHNSLNDTIPMEIGKLTNLQILRLESNYLSGELPTAVVKLHQLIDLRLNNNELESTIPDKIGALKNLVRLSMGSNWFLGALPSSITNLSSLQILTCEDNFLTGRIPTDIGNMKNLEVFRCFLQRFDEVLRPGLVGTIPKSIGKLEKLKDLSLYQNGLTGNIPADLGFCTSLEILDLELNQLEGTIPQSLGKLTNLKVARFGGNDGIQNPLPESICSIESLQYRVGCGLPCSCCTIPCGSRDVTAVK